MTQTNEHFPYFNVMLKGNTGVGGFTDLLEAQRYCAGEKIEGTIPIDPDDALSIEEYNAERKLVQRHPVRRIV